MDLLKKLAEGPAEIFDYVAECETAGYVPSQDEFYEVFDEKYTDWGYLFPDVRQELWGEVDNSQFQTFDDAMKYSGHKLSDFE